MKGFTLFELLIAMLLTAIIGAVMFKTWDLVIQSGGRAQDAVAARERDRIVFGIIDNDLASIIMTGEDDFSLPKLSKKPLVPDDAFYEALGRKKESTLPRGASVLLSFAAGSSLRPDGARLGYPVCVEYLLLRETTSGQSLIRREREHCGVSGDFPWTETKLMENLRDASMELVFEDGTEMEKWTAGDLGNAPAALRFCWRKEGGKEEEALFPLFTRREEIGWEDE